MVDALQFALFLLLYVKLGSCHINFCINSFWFDPTGYRTRVYCTVFTRFVARALIFFNLTHCRAPIQTGVYLSTGACYFQSKITTKIIVEDKYFTTFNLSPYDLFTSNTNQHHHPHEHQHHHPHEHQHQNVINAICYAIGRLRRDCCLLALKIQQRCDTSVS